LLADADFVFENAPLQEVIVQVWWGLQPIFGSQGAALDPHAVAFFEDFRARSGQKGFGYVERVVPEQVPLEVLAHQVVLRFRKRQGEWPVFQIGPGVLTVNIVPPYRGWTEFARTVEAGLELLWQSYPLASRYLKIERLHLNYINAFTSSHGLTSLATFARDHLGLTPELRTSLLDLASSQDAARFNGTIEFPVRTPPGARLVIQFGPGKVAEKQALIVQNQVIATDENAPKDQRKIMDWLYKAREDTHAAFIALLSPEVKEKIGPATPIQAHSRN
jgi:uncharacterized protein (TIGR04255 family)